MLGQIPRRKPDLIHILALLAVQQRQKHHYCCADYVALIFLITELVSFSK